MAVEIGSVMARLRDETTEHHKRAENKPLEIAMVSGELPREMYIAMLQQRLLIHRELEAHIRTLRATDPVVATIVPDKLFQEENIRADLESFSADTDDITSLTATQKLIDRIRYYATEMPQALLGIYYVFEGSKNGSRFIARKLGPALQLSRESGMRYLDPHGDEQRPLWLEFKQMMDAAEFAEPIQDEMVTAAKMTFDAIADLDDELYAVA